MPTGSGKTIIGLLIAEFHRRKYQRKALFLCPTNQLVKQVSQQAKKQYGIETISFCGKQSEYFPSDRTAYMLSKKIGVTTYSSFFATSEYFNDVDILIFDDVHSAENYIADGWSLDIQRKDYQILYHELAEVFKDALGDSDYSKMITDSPYTGDSVNWCNMIPYPKIKNKMGEIYNIIDANIKETSLRFSWSRIEAHLNECNIFVSCDSILIRPYIAPTESFFPFKNAKQCIFMSATLGNSGEIERVVGVDIIKRLPMVNDWDKKGLGRKFFIFPDLSFGEKDHSKIIFSLHKIASKSVVIVPSTRDQQNLATKIKENLPETEIFDVDDLTNSKERFSQCDNAMAILANRFDGIDFPDNESRMLIIYNLPKVTHLQEKFFYSKMAASVLYSERVKTRIVQAVGRCTRNAKDYASVCILGHTVLNELVSDKSLKEYKPEMRAEIKFGINNSTELKNKEEIIENVEMFLARDSSWLEAEENIVHLRDEYVNEGEENNQHQIYKKLHSAAIKEVKLQYSLWKKDYCKAFEVIQDIIDELDAPALRGYKCFWQYLGGTIGLELGQTYLKKSTQLFRDAAKDNLGVTWLSQLIDLFESKNEEEHNNYFIDVIERLEEQMERFRSSKHFELNVTEILTGIAQETGTSFENYQERLGTILGYFSKNPMENGAPDPYWIINDYICIVSEDKIYDSASKKIPIADVTQAQRHKTWIRNNVTVLRKDAKIYTVFITNAESIEEGARIHADDIFYCKRKDFVSWATSALNCLRSCRATFTGVGDPIWRSESEQIFVKNGCTPLDLIGMITGKPLKNI